MSWLLAARTRLRLLLARRDAEARMDEEFRLHIELETEKNIREGMDPREARRQALLAFGGVEFYKEQMRDGRGGRWLEDLTRDLRHAARGLSRTPVFALVAVLTIAVGVGATTTVFGMVNAILLRSLPVPSPERLFALHESRRGAVWQGAEGPGVPYARYVRYRDATGALFTGLAAHRLTVFSLRAGDEATAARGTMTSGNYFEVLGLRPELGAFFSRDDEPSVVLSHHFWRDRFGGDPAVLGSVVYLDSQPFTVVGIAPRGFTGAVPGATSDLWVPVVAARRTAGLESMAAWVAVFGRLRPGVEPDAASGLVNTTARRIPPDEPQTHIRGATLEPISGIVRGADRDEARIALTMLFGTALLVLLIAGVNVAGMLLARGVARRREIGIRLAMGAGRGRIVRQLLTESTLLALLGGAGGVLLALVGARAIAAAPLGLPYQLELDLAPDLRVLVFALATTLSAAILFGLHPALQTARPEILPALRDDAADAPGTARWRTLFVPAQFAMAVVLLVLAGRFVDSFRRLLDVDLGFEPGGVVVATIDLGPHGYDATTGRVFFESLVERLSGTPGVTHVALAGAPLLRGGGTRGDVRAPGDGEERREYGVPQNPVDPSVFATLRLPIVAGRGFTDADRDGAPRVAIVNETLARRLWPDENPLGRIIATHEGEAQVVGVVRDGRYGMRNNAPGPYAFFPFAQRFTPRITLHVRYDDAGAGIGPGALIHRIREVVRELDPNVAVQEAELLSARVDRTLGPQRYAAGLLGLFGVLGIALAGIGVYGVLAFQVAQRTREFGIRIALGAPARAVMLQVVGRWAVLAGTGSAVGFMVGHAASLALQHALYGMSAFDPATSLGIALLLATVGAAASLVPVRRAVRANPVEALRAE